MHLLSRIIATIWTAAATAAAAQVTYQWTDITPPGGRVYSVGTHPLDGRIIVFGQFTAQEKTVPVMYSNDHGATWNTPDTFLPSYLSSMFVHVGMPGVVYLDAYGLYFHPGPAAPGVFPQDARNGEVYRSDDFGRTWSLAKKSPDGQGIHPFASDPLDAHGIFGTARIETPCGFVPGCRYIGDLGITQTHDDGVSWSAPQGPIDPRFAPGVFANIAGPTPADPMRLFLGVSGKVMESRDRGATWSTFAPPLPRLDAVVPSLPPRLDSAVPDPLRANVLYVVRYFFDGTFNHYSRLRSDDGGANWRQIFDSPFSSAPPVIDPARTRTLWIGPEPDSNTTLALFRSDDAGETWQAVPCPIGCFGGVVPSTAEPGTVYTVSNYHLLRAVPSSTRDPIVVEYHYEADRYWLTSLDGEAVSQDYRQQPGNVFRTGLRWGAWNASDAPAGAVGSCRFWPKTARTRVLVQQGFECDILKRDPNWILEGENEFFTLPPINNSCPAGTVTVDRFINLQPDFNHRWVADPAIAADMEARGWYDEGVRFCARPLGPNE